jgi:hypothetical protein
MVAKGSQTPFKANVVMLDVLVRLEVLVFLVYAVVGKMHKLVRFA